MRAPVSAAAAALLVACSTAIDDVGVPIDGLDLAPRRTTAAAGHVATRPVVELARGSIDGSDFSIVAWPEADGLCIFAVSGADSGLACGPAPGGPAGQIGLLMTDALGSGGPLELVGAASAEVTEVVAEFRDGRRARGSLVPLAPAELNGSLFLLVTPADVGDHEVVVRGADGVELQRLELLDAG